jgi:hypothetical protein
MARTCSTQVASYLKLIPRPPAEDNEFILEAVLQSKLDLTHGYGD